VTCAAFGTHFYVIALRASPAARPVVMVVVVVVVVVVL
jgi:hypothetical protein